MTPSFDCTLTLDAIRAQHPCRDGWLSLLRYLKQTDASIDLTIRVSLGDIAVANGAIDAWWCIRALHCDDVAVRRAVIAALIPSLRRISAPHEIVDLILEWCAGTNINLLILGQKAEAVRGEAAGTVGAAAAAWAAAVAAAAWAAPSEENTSELQ